MKVNMNDQPKPGSANNGQRTAIIIVVVLGLIVLAAIFLGGRGNDQGTNNDQADNADDRPAGGNQANDETFAQEGIILGDFVAGTALDRDSCVTQTTSSFDNDNPIYVGLLDSTIPANTPVFVRLYRDDVAVEDTEEVRSPEDFEGCIWFEFSATARAEELENGAYEAEIFVNSRPADTISFNVG